MRLSTGKYSISLLLLFHLLLFFTKIGFLSKSAYNSKSQSMRRSKRLCVQATRRLTIRKDRKMMEGTHYQLKCARDMHKGGTEIGQSETRVITTASQIFSVFVQNFLSRWPISAVKKNKKNKRCREVFYIFTRYFVTATKQLYASKQQ